MVEPGRAVANRFVTLETDITDLTAPNGPVATATQVAQAAKSLSEANEQYIGTGGSIINGIQSKLNNPQTPSNPSGAASALASYIGQVDTSVRQYADGRINANTQRIDSLQAFVGPQGNLLVNASFLAFADYSIRNVGAVPNIIEYDVFEPPHWSALDSEGDKTLLLNYGPPPSTSGYWLISQNIPVEPNKYYMCSVYIANAFSQVSVDCDYFNDANQVILGSLRSTGDRSKFYW